MPWRFRLSPVDDPRGPRLSRRFRARALTAVAAFVLTAGFLGADVLGAFPVLDLSAAPAPPADMTLDASLASLSAPRHGFGMGPAEAPGLAMAPPMGWNGYNHFHLKVTAATVEAAARALVSSKMAEAGYRYVNLDGGWDLRWRDSRGALWPDPRKFPQGIKPVADYVHSLGLKFGIYVSAGVFNCAGTSAGSFGHYRQDAASFAAWGVDYVKLDWCDVPFWQFSPTPPATVSRALATQMRDALAATKRPIVFDVNDWTGDRPWMWAGGVGHMWRTTPDIQDRYQSLLLNFTRNVDRYGNASPGGWNDPDMLEVGNGGMSTVEYTSMFSLWAEMAAPLIAGNDLTRMSPATASILTNSAVIAVDQDPLGRQGYPVASAGGHWVLTKPLQFGDRAVVLFNQTDRAATIATTAKQVGMQTASSYTLFNLWSGSVDSTTGLISVTVPPHGVVMFKLTVVADPAGDQS